MLELIVHNFLQYRLDNDLIFSQNSPVETRDLDENTLIDLDQDDQLCSMTIEHAKQTVGFPEIEYETVN